MPAPTEAQPGAHQDAEPEPLSPAYTAPTTGSVLGDVPSEVHDRGWQWRPIDADTAFAPPFGTIRQCIGCGALVGGGPNRCVRCALDYDREQDARPVATPAPSSPAAASEAPGVGLLLKRAHELEVGVLTVSGGAIVIQSAASDTCECVVFGRLSRALDAALKEEK